jgi:protein-tyrosine phosphatase
MLCYLSLMRMPQRGTGKPPSFWNSLMKKQYYFLLSLCLFGWLLFPTASKGHPRSHKIEKPKRFACYETPFTHIALDAQNDALLKEAFSKIRLLSHEQREKAREGKAPQNIAKNRHKYIVAVDKTRTCRDIPGFYINANDVHTPFQDYIVTQGPLDSTVDDFWKMILYKDVSLIITLAMEYEEGREKCAAFWEKEKLPQNIQYVSQELLAEKKGHRIVVRTFVANKKPIVQLHYENWPDNGTPDPDLFSQFLNYADFYNTQKNPICVHCSAGIGRSGTFVAAHSIRNELRMATFPSCSRVNIPHVVYLLRKDRRSLVGTYRQLQAVYLAVAKTFDTRQRPFFIMLSPMRL